MGKLRFYGFAKKTQFAFWRVFLILCVLVEKNSVLLLMWKLDFAVLVKKLIFIRRKFYILLFWPKNLLCFLFVVKLSFAILMGKLDLLFWIEIMIFTFWQENSILMFWWNFWFFDFESITWFFCLKYYMISTIIDITYFYMCI